MKCWEPLKFICLLFKYSKRRNSEISYEMVYDDSKSKYY
nr:MAG TPA: hypothetical protein [Caudoviricetes sp.]